MSEGTDRRSPYLVLGLDYGAPADQARRAFARKARQMRRAEGSAFGIEDLTWALHEIEGSSDALASSVEFFRVPANRAALPQAREGELFAPAPVPLPRRSSPPSSNELDALTAVAARNLVDELLAQVAPQPVDDPYSRERNPSA
jgi:hypothetical protein